MRMTIFLLAGMTALLAGVVFAVPTYALDQNSDNVFSLLANTSGATGSDAPVFMQVRRGGGSHGAAFHSGGHHGRRGFVGGFFLGGPLYYGYDPYWGDGEGYYTEGNKVCVWNGYEYRCYTPY